MRQARVWEFHVQWQDQLATTHSRLAHAPASVRVVHVQPVPVVQVVQVAHLVRVAHHVQVSAAVTPVAHLVQVSVAELQVPVVPALVVHVRPVALAAVDAETAAEPLVPSVRVEVAELRRLASRSVRNVKSSNREWLQAWVVQ